MNDELLARLLHVGWFIRTLLPWKVFSNSSGERTDFWTRAKLSVLGNR